MSRWLMGGALCPSPCQRGDDVIRCRTAACARRCLDARGDHLAIGLEGVPGADVVAELGGLGHAIPHVLPALGVVDGACLGGDGAAHDPAAQPVQQARVGAAELVEVEARRQPTAVEPSRCVTSVLDELGQVARESRGQRLAVRVPGTQERVETGDAVHAGLLEHAADHPVGRRVPHVLGRHGVELAAGDGLAAVPGPGRRQRTQCPEDADDPARLQETAPADGHARFPRSTRSLHLLSGL